VNSELDFGKVDSSNEFGVGIAGNGEVRIHWQPTEAPVRLSHQQAVNLLAWLRLLVDPTGQESARLIERIKAT